MQHSLFDSNKEYLVSALVPTYGAGRFMRGLLEDLEAQTIADKLQIVIVDTASPTNEQEIVNEFQQHYDNILYMRTEHKENSHEATIRAMQLATGKYFTLACTDDRHKHDAYERMATVLELRPDIALVYGNVNITKVENQTFDHFTSAGIYRWFDFDPWKLLYCCFMGPQPMWRKELHESYGYFDGTLESAGDWEFWLRMSESETFLHIDEYLGLYLLSPTSSFHKNPELTQHEGKLVQQKYIERAQHYKNAHVHALRLSSPDRNAFIDTQNIAVDLRQFEPTRFHRNWIVNILTNENSPDELERTVKEVREWLTPTTTVSLRIVGENPENTTIAVSPKMLSLQESLTQAIEWEADHLLVMNATYRFTAEVMQTLHDSMAANPADIAFFPNEAGVMSSSNIAQVQPQARAIEWLVLSAEKVRQRKLDLPDRIENIADIMHWLELIEQKNAGKAELENQRDSEELLLLALISEQLPEIAYPDIISLVKTWIQQGRYVESEVVLQKLIQLYPEYSDARSLLEDVLQITRRVTVNIQAT